MMQVAKHRFVVGSIHALAAARHAGSGGFDSAGSASNASRNGECSWPASWISASRGWIVTRRWGGRTAPATACAAKRREDVVVGNIGIGGPDWDIALVRYNATGAWTPLRWRRQGDYVDGHGVDAAFSVALQATERSSWQGRPVSAPPTTLRSCATTRTGAWTRPSTATAK